MSRITITITERTKAALIKYAQREMRDPRVQAAIIIVNKLNQCGYLSKDLVQLEIGEVQGSNEEFNKRKEE